MSEPGSDELELREAAAAGSYREVRGAHHWSFPNGTELEFLPGVWERLSYDVAGCEKRAASGEEIGGLLIGSRDPKSQTIRVESTDTYSGEALHAMVRHVVERVSKRSSSALVGWFRITGSGDTVTPADEILMRSQFEDTSSILLLIQRSATETAQGRMVFWRERQLESVTLPFPVVPVSAAAARAVLRELDPPPAPSWLRKHWAALTVIVLLLAGGRYWYQNRPAPPVLEPPPIAKAPPEPPSIDLRAVQDRNLVRVVWDPKAPEVRAALSGQLSFTDGDKRSTVALDSMRLAAGLYWYPATTNKVGVVFQLRESDGREIEKNAQVSLKYTPTPAPAPEKKDSPLPTAVPALPTPSLPLPPLPAKPVVASNAGGSAPAPAADPPTAAPTRVPEPGIAPSVPAVQPPPQQPSVPPAKPSAAPYVAAKQPSIAAAKVDPAIPITKAQPLLPVSLRALIVKPTQIDVEMTIDTNGRVINAEALHTEGMLLTSLGKLAADTAKLWRFSPASRQGQPIQSTLTIPFLFQPPR